MNAAVHNRVKNVAQRQQTLPCAVEMQGRQHTREADPEADLALANCSGPEEDDIQGLSVQAPLGLGKAGVLTEVDELEVVHAQLVDVAGRTPLADAVVLAIHTEVLEALLQGRIAFIACTLTKNSMP